METPVVQLRKAEYYLPSARMTLEQMAALTGAPAEVISEKIGIEEKRIAAPDEQPSDLAVKAGRQLMDGIDPLSIDVVIYCGATPADYPFWVCGHKIQAELGLKNAFVFDLHAICAGTVYAIFIAKSMITADPTIHRVLIAGGEKFSAVCNATTYKNLSALRYADGGGALLVERGSRFNEVLASHFISKGELNAYVKIPAGGTALSASHDTVDGDMHCIQCTDADALKTIFRETYTETYRNIIETSMAKSHVEKRKPDYLILNQTDSNSTRGIVEVLGMEETNMISTRRTLGHMGIVDQIMIWKLLHEQKPLVSGDVIVLASSGIGFSWGAVTVRFHSTFLEV